MSKESSHKSHKKHSSKKEPHQTSHHKKSPHHDDFEEELRAIYELDADGEDGKDEVDMTRLEVVSTPVVRRILVTSLFILIAIAAGLVGALLLNNPFKNDQEALFSFELVSEETFVSGQETTIRIPYQNPNNFPLANLEFILHTPAGFEVADITPTPTDQAPLTWNLGTLGAEESGEIVLRGRFFAPENIERTIQAITRYKPANFSSSFEDIQSIRLRASESIFDVRGEGPERVIPEEEATYSFTVSHTDLTPHNDLELRVTIPDGFQVSATSQTPREEDTLIWDIATLDPEEVYTLDLTGEYTSDIQGDLVFQATIGRLVEGEFIPQTMAEIPTNVVASNIALSMVINGQSGDSILLPGQPLNINLDLANRSEEAIENISIELFIDEGLERLNVSGREGVLKGDFYTNKINWDQTDTDSLQAIPGFENTSIDLTIPTYTSGPARVTLHGEAVIKLISGITLRRELSSRPITLQVASDLAGEVIGRYYATDGSPLGSGPMPPRVGQETTYEVTWRLTNVQNAVSGVTMIAPMGERVSWAGRTNVTSGTLTFDSISNRVRWSLGQLPAGGESPTATFQLTVAPNSSDIGHFVDILDYATITATDSVAGVEISSVAPALTTELPSDSFAADQGVVVE